LFLDLEPRSTRLSLQIPLTWKEVEIPMSAPKAGAVPISPAKNVWSVPQLVRLGSVATVTSKKDNIGRNDGGTGTKKRT
jgi:hypothetical protein